MSFAGGEGAQPEPSGRDSVITEETHVPVFNSSQDREISPLDVQVRRSGSDTEQPTPATKTGGDAIDGEQEELEAPVSPREAVVKEILDAIKIGVPAAVDVVLAKTKAGVDVVGALTNVTSQGMTLLAHAARTGNVEILIAVDRCMAKHLSPDQARKTYTTTAENGRGSVLMSAAYGESDAIFSKIVGLLDGEVLRTIAQSWRYGCKTIVKAAEDGGLKTFTAVTSILNTKITREQAVEAVTSNAGGGPTAFTAAVQRGNRHIVWAWADVLLANLPRKMVIEASTRTFAACLPHLRACSEAMSVLVALGATTTAADLISLKPEVTLDELKICFFGGICSAESPLTSGMALSVAVETAVRILPERERQALSNFKEKLDELLLEVLERLPQSIQSLPGGLAGCVALFEPETVDIRGVGRRVDKFEPEGVGLDGVVGRVEAEVSEPEAGGVEEVEYRGPLKLALQERQFTETICVSPLVFEYLSHKFVCGLPMPWDSEHHISSTYDHYQGSEIFNGDGMVAESDLGRLMQGLRLTSRGSFDTPRDWEKLLSSTIYPGAQFVAAGIATKPMAFYKVPAIRMFLDFLVHLLMLTLYTLVLLEGDDGSVSMAEIALTFHVTAEIVNELDEMYANFHEWVKNEWNWLQSVSLVLLAAALLRRIGYGDGWMGRALFALSAPLVFSRVLFYGQVLRRQGLVVQAITIMIGELLQFGLVLVVVMMGFTVAFHVLFGDDLPYGSVWLGVFKAMLGEVGVFDNFLNGLYGSVAKFLLVIYLFFITIMLLNLLIAILSTEHAKIEQGQDRAFRVSKIRIIKLFSRVVDKDTQPPPFNLIQLALILPFLATDKICRTSTHEKVKRTVGVLVFWLVVGPLSIVAAWGLCIASAPNAVIAPWRNNMDNRLRGKASIYVLSCSTAAVCFRVFFVPVVLIALWIQAGVVEWFRSVKYVIMSLFRVKNGRGAAKTSPGAYRRKFSGKTRELADEKASSNDNVGMRQQHRSNAVSVAEMLRRSHGRQKTMREIWTYLDDLVSTDGRHHIDKDSPATAENLNRVRSQLQSTAEKRGEAIVAHLKSFDTALQRGVQEVGQKVNSRIDVLDQGVNKRLDRLEDKMAAMVAGYLAGMNE